MLDLYHKYFSDRKFERLDLFRIIADKFDIQRVLYPGSFVHITPSFIFPVVVYVDNDKQAEKFFSAPELRDFIDRRKAFSQDAQTVFHSSDYRNGFDEADESFDLLVSQYAGFVGQACKRYLKKGGVLLANNSHGDAGVAAIDHDYELIAVISLSNENYRISETNLAEYFVPKSTVNLTKQYLEGLQRGIGYRRAASNYIFRRVR